jgi:hypothetical protein
MFGLVKVNDPLLGAAEKDLEMNSGMFEEESWGVEEKLPRLELEVELVLECEWPILTLMLLLQRHSLWPELSRGSE